MTAPTTRPFHQLPNLLMTPHVSGWTDGVLDARAKLIAESVARTFGKGSFQLPEPIAMLAANAG